jgi:hypothetical protein
MIIRRYQAGDEFKVSDFMYRCFVRDTDHEVRSHAADYYAWKYGKNPWGNPVVWVAEEDGLFSGIMAVVPKRIWIQGKSLLCGESGDTFMDRKGKNVFLEMAYNVFKDCHDKGLQLIYGSPNRVSYPLFTRVFEYKELFLYHSLIRPMHMDQLIRARFGADTVLGFFGKPLDALYQKLFWPNVGSNPYSLEDISESDGRFDAIWMSLCSRSLCSVIKDSRYIQWRYFDCPEDFQVGIIHLDKKPVGYVVFKLTRMHDVLCGHIADLTISPVTRPAIRKLWACLLHSLRAMKVDVVNTWTISAHPFIPFMKRFGFIMRKKPFWMIMRGENQALSGLEDLKKAGNWMFSQADTDNI